MIVSSSNEIYLRGGYLMPDVFEMPNNAENYYRKAKNLIEQQRYNEAAIFLEKSYKLEPNLDIFDELVKLYLTFNLETELKFLWQTVYPDTECIYKDKHLSFLYGQSISSIYDSQHALLELYHLKEIAHSMNWQTDHLIKAISQLNDQHLFEKTVRKAKSFEANEQLVSQLLEKGNFQLLSQIKSLYKMPINETDTLIRTLLKHPKVMHYLKSDLLHFLINQNNKDTYEIIWFGSNYSLSIKNLETYREQPIYAATIASIQDYCDAQNPHLFDDICQQFTMHAMIYYPFITEIVSSGQAWLDIFLVQNGLEDETSKTQLNQDLLAYYTLANEELMTLLQPPL